MRSLNVGCGVLKRIMGLEGSSRGIETGEVRPTSELLRD